MLPIAIFFGRTLSSLTSREIADNCRLEESFAVSICSKYIAAAGSSFAFLAKYRPFLG
jgi:hypothetical protein